jgi:hypothetical protein
MTEQNKHVNQALKQVRDNLARKSTHFKTCFSTVSGMETLKALKEEFDVLTICAHDADATTITVLAAQRDVLKYIELMMNHKE